MKPQFAVCAAGLVLMAACADSGANHQPILDDAANLNLLRTAEGAGVAQFAYIHVLRASETAQVPMVAARSAFVAELQRAALATTVIAPTGYFSDVADVPNMARSGRAWLFGDGGKRINPIHGADLASATAKATEAGVGWLDVGGPDVFTRREVAELAFASLDKSPPITMLPDVIRRIALRLLPIVAPHRISGPARFFLAAPGLDMVGECHGTRCLKDHFTDIIAQTGSAPVRPLATKGQKS